MANRRFTLQPALSYKERLEDIRQLELAEIEASYAAEQRMLEFLCELENSGYRQLEQQHSGGRLDMAAIGAFFSELQSLQKKTERQLLVLQELAGKVRQKRDELIEVSKEKKVLEKLKEKHETKVAHELKKAEGKIMEDIATSQFHRRKTVPR